MHHVRGAYVPEYHGMKFFDFATVSDVKIIVSFFSLFLVFLCLRPCSLERRKCQPQQEHQRAGTCQSQHQGVNNTQSCWRCDTVPALCTLIHIGLNHYIMHQARGLVQLIKHLWRPPLPCSCPLWKKIKKKKSISHCPNWTTQRDAWESSCSGTDSVACKSCC